MSSVQNIIGAFVGLASLAWLFLVLPRLGRKHDAWERAYNAACDAFERDRMDEAESRIRQAYRIAGEMEWRPHEPRALSAFALAEVLQKTGRSEEAERRCREAAELLRQGPVQGLEASEVAELLGTIRSA